MAGKTSSIKEPVFCCASARPVSTTKSHKLYHDPNQEVHEIIFQSFLAFAVRRQQSADLFALILGISVEPGLPDVRHQSITPPVLTQEALRNNPLTPYVPYVIHLTSRHDFGLVYSHRYFVCPRNLQQDWIEVTLQQWFAVGESFKLRAEKWDIKCVDDSRFFRLSLRPNLAMRTCFSVQGP